MQPDHQQTEDKRKELGRSDEPVEDELVEEFENTVAEGADRLNRTWRALVITGLFALRLAHSELFTEDFLIPINAVVAKHGTWLQLCRLWTVTLVANLAGGWLFMWVVGAAFPQFEQLLLETSLKYMEGGLTLETAALAILAGSTITLSTRMSQGTSDDVVTALISLISGLLVVGLGMLHGALNSIVIFGAMHLGAAISYSDWFVWFLWVIPLNMVGGLVIITLPRLIRTLELIKKERAEQSKKLVAQGLED